MIKLKSPSGADIEIEPASFEDTFELWQAISERLLLLNIEVDYAFKSFIALFANKKAEDASFSLEKLEGSDLLAVDGASDILMKGFLGITSSPKVRDCVFKCLDRSRYNGERIRKELFDNAEARKDFLFLLKEAIKANILPFANLPF